MKFGKISCKGCGVLLQKRAGNHVRCMACQSSRSQEKNARYGRKRWREKKTECRKTASRWRNKNPEVRSVYQHYEIIFNENNPSHKNYIGMPFFNKWNPKKGGSFQVAKQWILENIGKRPKDCSLHIVEQEKGFVPGNLAWASRKVQNSQQARYEISRLKHRISVLEERLRKCG